MKVSAGFSGSRDDSECSEAGFTSPADFATLLRNMDNLREIFGKITEHYSVPIRVGSKCEASVYYRVEDLSSEDLRLCADYVAQRITKVIAPALPHFLVNLKGSYTGLAQLLAQELAPPGETLEVVSYDELNRGNGKSAQVKNAQVILVNDVITTARSCLEAHTRVTMMGASITCWAALIDRTFGPGPVPIVTAFTGEPVTLLEGIP